MEVVPLGLSEPLGRLRSLICYELDFHPLHVQARPSTLVRPGQGQPKKNSALHNGNSQILAGLKLARCGIDPHIHIYASYPLDHGRFVNKIFRIVIVHAN